MLLLLEPSVLLFHLFPHPSAATHTSSTSLVFPLLSGLYASGSGSVCQGSISIYICLLLPANCSFCTHTARARGSIPADQADGFESGSSSAGEICDDDNSSLDLHGTDGRRPESSPAVQHGRLTACNDHGSSTGAHGGAALWNSSSRCMYIHNLIISTYCHLCT
jgi:hypothetical protein